MQQRKVETSVAWITLIGEDILRIEYKPYCYVDVAEFEENLQAYRTIMKTEKVFVLTIANTGAESSPEVRNIFASQQRSGFKIAEAFVISSLAQRIVANYVMKFQKPSHPLRFFNSEAEAMNWLLGQRSDLKAESPETVL